MLNLNKSYGTVFKPEVNEKGNMVRARLSTSVKNKETGKYTNSYWNVRFVGKCVDLAKQLKDRDRITILNGVVENVWDPGQKKTWLNVVVFDFAYNMHQSTSPEGFSEIDDSELPF